MKQAVDGVSWQMTANWPRVQPIMLSCFFRRKMVAVFFVLYTICFVLAFMLFSPLFFVYLEFFIDLRVFLFFLFFFAFSRFAYYSFRPPR